jgi:hypothetical protein
MTEVKAATAALSCGYSRRVRLYALVQAGDREAIDVYLAEEDAQRALEDCFRDEPEWRGELWI